MALVVIEGVDRTGKSTLADKLPKLLHECTNRGTRVVHCERPERARAADEYLEPLLSYEPGKGRNLVLDRSHVGEAVWPTIFDRSACLTRGEYALLHEAYVSRGAVFVLCRRERGDLHRAIVEADPPEPLPPEKVTPALAMFEEQFEYIGAHSGWTFFHDHLETRPEDIATKAWTAENDALERGGFSSLPDSLDVPALAGLIR